MLTELAQLTILFQRREHIRPAKGSHYCVVTSSKHIYYMLDSEPRWDGFNQTEKGVVDNTLLCQTISLITTRDALAAVSWCFDCF